MEGEEEKKDMTTRLVVWTAPTRLRAVTVRLERERKCTKTGSVLAPTVVQQVRTCSGAARAIPARGWCPQISKRMLTGISKNAAFWTSKRE
mmetsp:Transcript_21479/g.35968  ORF Transcript_21479/g.35968 Transcript_21479/m.35968 type:complete len:91 (+) Transcript_21479:1278-1550(+)